MGLFSFLARAFSSNLRTAKVLAGERTKLDACGIENPTVQRYLAWRRSIFAIVVIATGLGAALATANELGVFDNFSGRLWSLADEVAEQIEGADVDGEDNATGDRTPAAAKEKMTKFAEFAEWTHLICMYSLPIAALAASLCWTRQKLSYRILLAGWAFGFFMPMAIALCPWSWWGATDPVAAKVDQKIQHLERIAEGVKEGAEYLIMLLPTVLSLIPGVQRACLRIKNLLPESMLPGWFLVSAAPFNSLLLLVIFIAVNQVASNPLFLAGMFLLLAAPLVYVVRADVLTRPLTTDEDYRKMQQVKRLVGGITAIAAMLLIAYVSTQRIFGMKLIGMDPKSSLLHPMDLTEYVVEFIGRSLFMTVLAADVFLGMNVASWRYSKVLSGTPQAEKYDGVMTGFEQLR